VNWKTIFTPSTVIVSPVSPISFVGGISDDVPVAVGTPPALAVGDGDADFVAVGDRDGDEPPVGDCDGDAPPDDAFGQPAGQPQVLQQLFRQK
jgi:hypothetical protein